MDNPLQCLVALCVLAVSSWITPQPAYSQGLLVVYGNQRLVEANAQWHGYDLSRLPDHCGFSAISPAMLGRVAWLSVDGMRWLGPCLSVDSVGRMDAYQSIFSRHEIGEIRGLDAQRLGFKYGHAGFIFFGACPPDERAIPRPYQPPLAWDTYGQVTPSFYPYPKQEDTDCVPQRVHGASAAIRQGVWNPGGGQADAVRAGH